MPHVLKRLLVLSWAAAWAVACGGSGGLGSAPGDGDATACVPGQQSACECPGGEPGVKTCSADGAGYGGCTCGDAGGVDATTDGTTDGTVDVGPDVGSGDDATVDTGPGDDAGDDGGRIDDATGDARRHVDAGADAGRTDAGGGCTPDSGVSDGGGSLGWAQRFGIAGSTYPYGLAVDPVSGDIAISGVFSGTQDFGGGPVGGYDSFLVVYDSGGTFRWSKVWPFSAGELLHVSFDAKARLVVQVRVRQTIDFGCGSLTHTGSFDGFVVFDSSGTCVWNKLFPKPTKEGQDFTFAVDATGDVVLSGIAFDFDVGGGPMRGLFAAKLDSNGKYMWSHTFGVPAIGMNTWTSVAVDPFGNVLLAGSFAGKVDFGGGPLRSWVAPSGAVSVDSFVAKFDSMGRYQWAHEYGRGSGPSADGGYDLFQVTMDGVYTDSCGNAFVAGTSGTEQGTTTTGGTVDFGGGIVLTEAPNTPYVYLARIDPGGVGQWAKEFIVNSYSVQVVTGASGPVIVGSFFGSASVDFGGGPLQSTPAGSFFVADFDQTGTYRWGISGGPPSTAQSAATAATGAGRLVLNGTLGGPAGATLVLDGKTLTVGTTQDMFSVSFEP